MELLRRYTELRSQTFNADNIGQVRSQSEALHEQLWLRAVAAAEKDTGSIMTGLFLESLNETIDLHSKRVYVGLYSRITITIWLVLFALILLGMTSFGYQSGIAATQRSLGIPILALAFAAVFYLIFDLDRAHEGLMQVSQQTMVDLRNSMQVTSP